MISPFIIDEHLTGKQHLLVEDNELKWVDSIPHDVWHLSGQIKNDSTQCLDTLFKLEHHRLDLKPPERFVKTIEPFLRNKTTFVPWHQILPSSVYEDFLSILIQNTQDALIASNCDYYKKTWMNEQAFLRSLQPAHVDVDQLRVLISQNKGNVNALKTFLPANNDECLAVTYDRFATVTGRLTVSSGPDILTLKKEHRGQILRSAWGTMGKILYADFSALEVRTLLYEAGCRSSAADLYNEFRKSIFDDHFDRDTVKYAIIATTYGLSPKSLSEKINVSIEEATTIIKIIKSHFKTDELLHKLKNHYINHQFIRNGFERRVDVDSPLDRILINYWAQSTGVDVSLLGFKKFLETINEPKLVRPLFVLHDGMFLDCHNDVCDKVLSIHETRVDRYIQKFPLKIEIL